MNEDDIRSLLLRAGPADQQPPVGVDLAELISRGRRRRTIRGYVVMAGSAVGTVAVAVLIVAVAVGHSGGVQPVVPANAPKAPVPTTTHAPPSSTADATPTTTGSHPTSTSHTATTSNSPASATSSSVGTTTP